MQMEMEKPEEIHLCFSPADLPSLEVLYTTAIYWSFTTLTSVGYGDITPCNEYETPSILLALCLHTSDAPSTH